MTADQLAKLEEAYSKGILKVREGESWLEYQSMASMRIAINDAKVDLNKSRPIGLRAVSVRRDTRR